MIILRASWAIVTALLLTSPGAAVAEPEGGPAHWLEAIVRVHAEIPADARTAAFLGRERDGSGVVIDDAGLIVTIGYLITEAMGAEVTTASGQGSRADIVGFDIASGLGLLGAAETVGGQAVVDRRRNSAHREDTGGGRRLRRTGPRTAGGCCVAPDLCRLLGVPARGRDLYDATPPRLERRRFARTGRQTRRHRLTS